MARIRTIKPQFWTDESVVDLPYEYRLLFIGMWNFADDDGFIENKPKQIKLQVFPGDDVNVISGIRALVKRGMLESLSLDGVKVLRIRGWKDHQVISRPTPSTYRESYAKYQEGHTTHGALTEDSMSTHGGLHREGKGKEGKGREGKGVTKVGGGGNLSSDEPASAADLLEPWRCPTHQGIDTPCHACKSAKAAHKKREADALAFEKQAKRDRESEEKARLKAEDAATPADDGSGYNKALQAIKEAKK